MCKAILLEDVLDKYKEPRKVEVPLSKQERIDAKRAGSTKTHKIENQPAVFGKKGDEVTIVSDHVDIMIIENKAGTRTHLSTSKTTDDMSNSEIDQTREMMLLLGKECRDTRVFRNNTGMGWAGMSRRLPNGDVLIKNARPLHAGLCVGSSDLIGWTSVLITPEMVGKTVSVFTAIEDKKSRGVVTADQRNFINQVVASGGIAGVSRKPQDGVDIIKSYK